MYGCTSPREPIVRKVKRRGFLGLKVKKVEEVDVNMTAGSEFVIVSGAGGGSESSLDVVLETNSSRMRASR